MGDDPVDLYPAAAAPGHRRDQPDRLRERQRRRLPVGLRHDPVGLRRGRRPALRRARDARAPARRTAVPASATRITEADWRLFTTLLRFDPVYVTPLQVQPAQDRRLPEPVRVPARALPDGRESPRPIDFDHIKRHYYLTHRALNPSRIVPIGFELDLDAPHGREAGRRRPHGARIAPTTA